MTSPFLEIPPNRWVTSNDHAFAFRDNYPVSHGHTLVVPRRVFSTWFDATREEQAAILELIDEVKTQLDREFSPDGYNVGFNIGEAAGQTVMHLHVHVIPRFRGDVPDPTGGVRWVIPHRANYRAPGFPTALSELAQLSAKPFVESTTVRLLPGEDDMMERELVRCIRTRSYSRIDLLVSFIVSSGLEKLISAVKDALSHDARIRVLTTDYLNFTEAAALGWLLDQEDSPQGGLETKVFSAGALSFHAKAYLFWSEADTAHGEAFIGSSNLSRSGISGGVEWNLLSGNLHQARSAFENLWADKRSRRLTRSWLKQYRELKPAKVFPPEGDVAPEPLEEPKPYPVQEEALVELEETREAGFKSGLVVMATGLGKTWLAAFDTRRPEFSRVLFVAHREEILRQSRGVFGQVRPHSIRGLYLGSEKTSGAEIIFAGIQTLARHLEKFKPEQFDYLVIDEFHHASAKSYRKVIEYFRPKFLLGLTATPERMDGGDLLGLCDENLVYRCDLMEGIGRKLLSPFRYYGLKDVTDFAPIPWKNGKFDSAELTKRVETQKRARQAFDEWKAKGGSRTLAFCCSVTHADFMAEWFRNEGVRAVAVHSGPTSSLRGKAIEDLEAGDLEVLFAVDVFNEGLDVPAIDTVLMLRPTESPVIFLQQLGRGLRRAEGKEFLTVIDFIGNHHSFLVRPRTLLSLGGGAKAASIASVLRAMKSGSFDLPEGCSIAYDLDVVDMLGKLLPKGKPALEDFCHAFHEEEGVRPSAAEVYRAGFNPGAVRSIHGSWFGFLDDLKLLDQSESRAVSDAADFLRDLEIEPTTKSYKLVTLKALLRQGALFKGLPVRQLSKASHDLVRRDPRLLRDVAHKAMPDPAAVSDEDWFDYWRKWPIAHGLES